MWTWKSFPCSPGHFLLTHLLIDLIKRSAPARIVTVSSLAHSWGSINLEDINSEKSYDKKQAYSQSKLANVLFTRSLAKRLEGVHCGLISSSSWIWFSFMLYSNSNQVPTWLSGTGVTTYSLHPGVVQTDLWRHLSGPQQVVMKIVSPFTKNSTQGAQTTIYCAVEPSLEKESGGYYRCTKHIHFMLQTIIHFLSATADANVEVGGEIKLFTAPYHSLPNSDWLI